MKDVLRLIRIDFCNIENRSSDAISETTIGLFCEKGDLTAHGVLSDWICKQPAEKLYLGWDGEFYPKFKAIKEKVCEE